MSKTPLLIEADRTVIRHQWSDDIKKQIHQLTKTDNYHWALLLTEDIFYILLAGFTAIYFLDTGWVSVPIYLICAFLIACRQRGLAELVHTSSHTSLASNRKLNNIIGSITASALLQNLASYKKSHIKGHHGHFGHPNLDPDLEYAIKEGQYSTKSERDFYIKYIVGPALLTKAFSKTYDLIINRLSSAFKSPMEFIKLFTFHLVVWLSAIMFDLVVEVTILWYLPLILIFPAVNYWIELAEHYPYALTSKHHIEMTRNRWTGQPWKFLFGIHNEHLHQVHHEFPRVPPWNQVKAHNILMRDPVYSACQTREVGLFKSPVKGIPSLISSMASRLYCWQKKTTKP